MKNKPYLWQKEALENWEKAGCRGSVNVITGGGKTLLALQAIKTLRAKYSQPEDLKIVIIVPTIFLVKQWANELRENNIFKTKDIGVYYSKVKSSIHKPLTIYVLNSAKTALSHHLTTLNKDVFLIFDEVHHATSPQSHYIFDFMNKIQNRALYTLGLSATINLQSYNQKVKPYLGNVIYNYGYQTAFREKIINDLFLTTIGVKLTAQEQTIYDELSTKIKNLIARLKLNPYQKDFFQILQTIALTNPQALTLLHLFYERSQILYVADNKAQATTLLISKLVFDSSIIIFTERIEIAELLYQNLQGNFKVGLYHSLLDSGQNKQTLEYFENKTIKILITCKALDEGLNIPATDVGIIVSSNTTKKQKIQRIGRTIRKKNTYNPTQIYYIYSLGTNEYDNVHQQLATIFPLKYPLIEMFYQNGELINPQFENFLVATIKTLEKSLTLLQIEEATSYLNIAKFRYEWLLAEDQIWQLIEQNPQFRKYYLSLLQLIRIKPKT